MADSKVKEICYGVLAVMLVAAFGVACMVAI